MGVMSIGLAKKPIEGPSARFLGADLAQKRWHVGKRPKTSVPGNEPSEREGNGPRYGRRQLYSARHGRLGILLRHCFIHEHHNEE